MYSNLWHGLRPSLYLRKRFTKPARVLMIVLTILYSVNFPAKAGHCGHGGHFRHRVVHRNQRVVKVVKVVEVQKVQQFVAVPVNPYYFSYNNISAISSYGHTSSILQNYAVQPVVQNAVYPQPIVQQQNFQQQYQQGYQHGYQQAQGYQQQQQQAANSQQGYAQPPPPQQQFQQPLAQQAAVAASNDERYVTKSEFRDFADKVFRALDIPQEVPPVSPQPDTPSAPGATVPTLEEVTAIMEQNHCAQCHSGPNSKGSNGRNFPIFLDGRIADNLNWDRIATKLMTQSMPPPDSGHPPVSTADAFKVSIFADRVTATQ